VGTGRPPYVLHTTSREAAAMPEPHAPGINSITTGW
jgi:hypothetical protein